MVIFESSNPPHRASEVGEPLSLESLVGALLDEQGDLSAVERFSRMHDLGAESDWGQRYSALLPGKPPGPGQQYAFEVDLDRCSGCKACVAACHALNGLDEGEAWREVGLIVGETRGLPVLQHVTTSCHHCLDPACMRACPVDAYEKDPVTGIVRHLDDQCFGCQYCTLACPYDAPKFHAGKGIVRKCDMCADRLRDGEPPACVRACPHEAIRIRLVDRDEVVGLAEGNGFLPTAPDPTYTLPTTRYVSDRPRLGVLRAGDHHREEPEHAHAPLVVMLVLTQAAAGGFVADLAGRSTGFWAPLLLPVLSLILGLLGLNASLLHLGRPLYAYRALIGLRHSWLSREVLAFGLFAKLALAHVAIVMFRPNLALTSVSLVAMSGLIAVGCSVMVYHLVRRPFWMAGISGPKFYGTVAVGGLAIAFLASAGARSIGLALIIAGLLKLIIDSHIFTHRNDLRSSALRRSAELMMGPLLGLTRLRLVLGVLGPVVLPLGSVVLGDLPSPAVRMVGAGAVMAITLGGELAERALFFRAVVRPKMPGGFPT